MQILTNGCEHLSMVSNDQVKVAAKNIKLFFFACELWVEVAGTFGVVLYCTQ